VGVYVQGEKMTSETGGSIRYWAHHQIARNYYQTENILSYEQFDAIDWRPVYNTLHSLPRLFQLWASKHDLSPSIHDHTKKKMKTQCSLHPTIKQN
jgi:hypothetical protein